jgi:Mn-dependent DtxR family transcriptional regulator
MGKKQGVIVRNSEKPTHREAECLKVFRNLVKRHPGVSPSLEELATEMGVKKATVQGFVEKLLAKGVLMRRAGVHRSLCLGTTAKKGGR